LISSIIITLLFVSCGQHSVDLGGFGHLAGYEDPVSNCMSCHGSDLMGEDEIPSCFACHDQKW
jgi:hypothetical protein